MKWSLVTVGAAGSEPVEIADAKAHLRVDHADEDALIVRLVSAAREYAERHTDLRLTSQTVKLTLDGFPGADCPIRLPGGPVGVVSSVKYRDTGGTLVTMAADADYRAWLDHSPALLFPGRLTVWPATDAGELRAVEVTYTVGGSIPDAVKQAILLIVAANYEARGDDRPADQADIPPAAKRLLDTVSTGAYL